MSLDREGSELEATADIKELAGREECFFLGRWFQSTCENSWETRVDNLRTKSGPGERRFGSEGNHGATESIPMPVGHAGIGHIWHSLEEVGRKAGGRLNCRLKRDPKRR